MRFFLQFSLKAPKGQREQKLEVMERKLKTMEEYVLQDTAKYAEIPQGNYWRSS